MRKTFS